VLLSIFLGAIEHLELSLSEMWKGLEKSLIIEDFGVWKREKMEKWRSFFL